MIDLSDAMDETIQATLEQVHTAIPGKIVSFDGELAVVQQVIKKQFRDLQELPFPEIHGVPVQFPRSKRGGIIFDIEPGDTGLIIFSERNCDNWVLDESETVPGDRGKFDLKDAYFIPGIFSVKESQKQSGQYKEKCTNIYRTDDGIINIENQLVKNTELIKELFRILKNFKTFGSSANHSTAPTTQAELELLEAENYKLYGE